MITAVILADKRNRKDPNAQIYLLEQLFPGINIVVVLGYRPNDLAIPPKVKVTINNNYDAVNDGFSLRLGLQECYRDKVLVLDGAYLYGDKLLQDFPMNKSTALLDKKKQVKTTVGARVLKDKIEVFGYGVRTMFGRALYLQGNELSVIRRECLKGSKTRHFIFELLNCSIDQGGEFTPYFAMEGEIK